MGMSVGVPAAPLVLSLPNGPVPTPRLTNHDSLITNQRLSDRNSPELESVLTRSKQTTATLSNRKKSRVLSRAPFHIPDWRGDGNRGLRGGCFRSMLPCGR
jgi:hypothetical protein